MLLWVLRHPTATISPTAKAEAGKTIVNASVNICKGVILASASIVDHGAVVGNYVHLAAGSMVQKGATARKDLLRENFEESYRGGIHTCIGM